MLNSNIFLGFVRHKTATSEGLWAYSIAKSFGQSMRGMSDDARRSALRNEHYTAAALEQPPELSGLTPSQSKAIADETLRARFPSEIAGINEAKQVLESAGTAFETVRIAAENELKASGGQIQPGPAARI